MIRGRYSVDITIRMLSAFEAVLSASSTGRRDLPIIPIRTAAVRRVDP